MPNSPKALIVVRHAESVRNAAKHGRIFFENDAARRDLMSMPDHKIPISDVGSEQSYRTGLALREKFGVPDIVYDSGYLRATETLDGILKSLSKAELARIEIRHHLFLRERDAGFTYNMTDKDVQRNFPWFDDYWKLFGDFFARPVGGESLAQVAERVWHFLETLKRDHEDKTVMIVAHGGTIRTIRFWLENLSYEQAQSGKGANGKTPANCGVLLYRPDAEGRLKLEGDEEVYWK